MWKKIIVGTLIGGLIGLVGVGLGMRWFVPASTPVNNAVRNANAQGTGNGFRGGGPGQGQGQGQGIAAQGNVQWTTVQGNVITVDQNAMTVQAANGEKIVVENRPWTFALEQKFAAKVGDSISLNGFYQNGLFEVGQMKNVTSGASVQLRDQSGRPGWAGRGNGGYNNGTVN